MALCFLPESPVWGKPTNESPADRPNVVLLLFDDLGWSDVGCYGNTIYETPNIDRLARQGMRMTDAYAACPVCSPTRASIMSGKYPATLNLTDWLPGMHPKNRPLIGPPFIRQLPTEEFTLAEAMRAAGYVTGSVGKWHLGGTGSLPEDHGFDVNIAGTSAGSPAGGYYLPNKMNLPDMKKGEYLTDRLSIEGCKFIRANKQRAFFLYLAHHSVHTPIQGRPDLVAKYRAKFAAAGIDANASYAAMVQSMDESVGRVLDLLDELDIAGRTVVLFMSDNGGLSSVTSNRPLREGKGHVYEGGIREPMIVRWPGVVRPGSVCGVPVSSVDFYPTILDLCDIEPSENQSLDGRSIVPLFEGNEEAVEELKRRPIFWHYPHYSPQRGVPAGAVRLGDFKLVELFEDGSLELYNLADDPGEQNNLAEKLPEKTHAMHGLLLDWRKRIGARLPTKNPDTT